MAVSFVGANGANAATVTLPAHQVGDLIVILAYRDGNTGLPTVPTAGGTVPTWTQISTGSANNNSARLHYTTATATNHTSGTWTNATEMVAVVYRGARIGNSAASGSNGSIITYPALTLVSTDGTSWVAGFAGHRTSTSVDLPPTGMVKRGSSTNFSAAGHDTNGGVTSWAAENVVQNASAGWRSFTLELQSLDHPLTAAAGAFAVTGVDAGLLYGAPVAITAEAGSFAITGQDATIVENSTVLAETGTVSVSGVDANLLVTRLLSASRRIFVIVGNNAALPYNRSIIGSAGSVSITGIAAQLIGGAVLPSQTGVFSVTRNPASVTTTRILTAAGRSFSILGISATLRPARRLTADKGTVAVTGIAANWTYIPIVKFDAGSFTISGKSAQLLSTRFVTGDRGIYTISGQSTPFTKGRRIAADVYSSLITGNTASVLRNAELSTNTRTYHINVGGPPNIDITRLITAATYSTVIVGKDATLSTANNQSLVTETGSLIITTVQAGWSKDYRLHASKGPVIITRNPAILTSTGTPIFAIITSVFADDGTFTIPVGLRTSIPWWEGDYQEFDTRLPLRIDLGRTYGDE